MFIKARTIVILGVAIMLAMIAEWKFVSFITEGQTIHNYHGICNDGVGQPYADFVHELRSLSESGLTRSPERTNLPQQIYCRLNRHGQNTHEWFVD
jgi:hypothetical protein